MDGGTAWLVRHRGLISSVLAAFFISIYVHTLVTTRPWIHSHFPGFVVMDNCLVPTVGAPGWPGLGGKVKFGDVVTAVDGRAVNRGREIYAHAASLPAGTQVLYTLSRKGDVVSATVPVTEFSVRDWVMLVPVLMTFGMFFYGTGVVVFFARPGSAAARAFLVNGALVGTAFVTIPAYVLTHQWIYIIQLMVIPLVGPSFALLGMYFPDPHPRRRLLLPLAFGPAVPVIAGYLIFFHNIALFVRFDLAMLLVMSVNNTLGMYLIGSSFYSSRDPATRQKAKIVVFGFSLMFLGAAVFVIGNLILKIMFLFWALPIALSMLPLSIAYAILKHNLFDVDLFIRRSVSYIIVTAAALAVLIALLGAFNLMFQRVSGQWSQAAAVTSTVIMMLLMSPFYRRVERFIARRFYREKYEYQSTIRRAASVLAGIVELRPLLDQVLFTVLDSLKVGRGVMVLKDRESGRWSVAAARGYRDGAELVPPKPGHPVISYLETEQRAVQLNELMELTEFGRDWSEAIFDIERLGLVLLVPVVYERRLIGVLGLGPKLSGAWYSSEDIGLLATLMVQAGVSVENAYKVEELKRMVALETSYRELQRLDEMKDGLLHMVSHDLRTPMTGILGYAYMLHEGVEDLAPRTQREYLNVVIKEGERLTRLINDLLDLQRFEAGRMEIDLSEIDLAEVVRDSARVFTVTMDNKGLRFAAELPADGILVKGDRDRLEQVIANLLSNAIKFTEAGGEIGLRAERLPGNGAGPEVKVTVIDTGRGIEPEYQAGVFDKFRQAQRRAAGSGSGGGSGLGLCLVKEIVNYHGGRVGFESEFGRGSRFYFFLPLCGKEETDEKGPDC